MKTLINNKSARFDDNGIVFEPEDASTAGSQSPEIDQDHNKVKQTAMHALKSKK